MMAQITIFYIVMILMAMNCSELETFIHVFIQCDL